MRLPGDKRSLDTLQSAILGGVSAAVLAAAILTAAAGLLLFSADPASHSRVGFVCLLLCCAAGAFIGARCTEKLPFTAGLAGGAVFVLTVVIVALIAPGKFDPLLLLPAAGAVTAGAFLGSIRRSGRDIPAFDDKKYDRFGK